MFEREQPDWVEHKLEHQGDNSASESFEQGYCKCVEIRPTTATRQFKEEHLHGGADVKTGAGVASESFKQVDLDGFGDEQEPEQLDRGEPGVRDADGGVLAKERGVEGDLQ